MKHGLPFYNRNYRTGMSRKQLDATAVNLVVKKRTTEEAGPVWHPDWRPLDIEPKESLACWYCSYEYPDGMRAIGLPERYNRIQATSPTSPTSPTFHERQEIQRQWLVSGSFCSPLCLQAYVHRTQMSDERRQLYLQHIRLYLRDIYGYTLTEQFYWHEQRQSLSLPFYALQKFGGPLTYEQYRASDCPKNVVVDAIPPVYLPHSVVVQVPSFTHPKIDFNMTGEKFVYTPPAKPAKKPPTHKRKKDQRLPSLLPVRKGISIGLKYPSVLNVLNS